MEYIHHDGGRAKAGYKGSAGDCAARAIAIVAEMPYKEVYDLINVFAKQEKPSKSRRGVSNARTGVHKVTMQKIMEHLGFKWTTCMTIGSGCKVHMDPSELPSGRIIVALSRHYAAVVDGVLYDTHDSSRNGTRCVYGYWKK